MISGSIISAKAIPPAIPEKPKCTNHIAPYCVNQGAGNDCGDADHHVGDESRISGEAARLLGAQLVGHRSAEIAKRVDTYATALFHEITVDSLSELDLSRPPPLGSPRDATQIAAQTWVRDQQRTATRPLIA
jgi:hypothetical protein